MRTKVLVVEDDPIQADVLTRLLGSHGYYVDVAGDGRSALHRLRTGTFDVALIDYRLPEIDGLGLARAVRLLGALVARPRLVALTSSPLDLVAGSADFDDILRKPFAPETLLQAIEHSRLVPTATGTADPATQSEDCDYGVSAAAASALPSRPTGPRGRILLAEDDADLLEVLCLTLESRGFAVDVAKDGLEAVGCIGTQSYDVVVVDFKMPRLDGLAAAKIIYDLIERHMRPRIVALTSRPASLIAEEPNWHLVLDEVVSKSNGIPAILSAIENCITYKALRSEKPLEVVDLQSMMHLVEGTA